MSVTQRIPFVDLITPHRELEPELLAVFRSALETAGFIGGPLVQQFEHNFAQFCGSESCVGVSSGTDALRLALLAAGVGPGQVVLTVPFTFVATAEAISQVGAQPEFVDIDERSYTMDPEKLREYLETLCEVGGANGRLINRKTGKSVTAVMPVHIYGQMADMDAVLELAGRYQLTVIEDACQAHGAEYFSRVENRWRKAGSMGHLAAFSFYPGKNLGACGEGGAVTSSDGELAEKVRILRDHGQTKKYHHALEGYNARLDAIQAGILDVKRPYLSEWNQQRRGNARLYNELFEPFRSSLTLPYEASWSRGVYHIYAIRCPERDQLQEHLTAAGIGTGIHYPVPVHLQEAFAYLGKRPGDFPVAERVSSEVLSLPMYPGLAGDQQQQVVYRTSEFLGRRAPAASWPQAQSA